MADENLRAKIAQPRVASLSCRSEPLTTYPEFKSTSAIPLMPMPPIPTK